MIPPANYTTAAAIVFAFLVAAVAVQIARRIVRGVLGTLDVVGGDNRAAVTARAGQLVRALTVLAYGAAIVASVSLALSRFGIEEARWDPRAVARWFATHGINALLIVAGAFVLIRAANLAIEHMQFKLARGHTAGDLEWQRRAATLSGLLSSLVSTAVGFVAVLMLLRELSVDVLPILTGAGIAGLAIGFGAQNLVRDVISGFFLILEDQVRVGDLARINGVTGTVEQVNLRTIMLRDGEGAVQVFPNGTVTALANLSKQFAYAVVDVQIAYRENLDRVIGTVREVGATMEKDAAFGPRLLGPLEVVGVVALDPAGATVQARFRTLPLNQGQVANELRKRLATTLSARGIRPFASG